MFNKCKVGEIKIIEVEFKWWFRWESWELKRLYIFLGVLFQLVFFNVQYWEYREDREQNNSYGDKTILKRYTKLLDYDLWYLFLNIFSNDLLFLSYILVWEINCGRIIID
jgi:hypothetical protein